MGGGGRGDMAVHNASSSTDPASSVMYHQTASGLAAEAGAGAYGAAGAAGAGDAAGGGAAAAAGGDGDDGGDGGAEGTQAASSSAADDGDGLDLRGAASTTLPASFVGRLGWRHSYVEGLGATAWQVCGRIIHYLLTNNELEAMTSFIIY